MKLGVDPLDVLGRSSPTVILIKGYLNILKKSNLLKQCIKNKNPAISKILIALFLSVLSFEAAIAQRQPIGNVEPGGWSSPPYISANVHRGDGPVLPLLTATAEVTKVYGQIIAQAKNLSNNQSVHALLLVDEKKYDYL